MVVIPLTFVGSISYVTAYNNNNNNNNNNNYYYYYNNNTRCYTWLFKFFFQCLYSSL